MKSDSYTVDINSPIALAEFLAVDFNYQQGLILASYSPTCKIQDVLRSKYEMQLGEDEMGLDAAAGFCALWFCLYHPNSKVVIVSPNEKRKELLANLFKAMVRARMQLARICEWFGSTMRIKGRPDWTFKVVSRASSSAKPNQEDILRDLKRPHLYINLSSSVSDKCSEAIESVSKLANVAIVNVW